MITTQIRFGVVLLGLGVSLSGCMIDSVPQGHLEGSLYQVNQSHNQSHSANLNSGDSNSESNSPSDLSWIDRELIGLDINLNKEDKEARIEVKDAHENTVSTLDLTHFSSHHFHLTVTNYINDLEMTEDDGCFNHSGQENVLLCFNKDAFLLEITGTGKLPIYTLSGNRFAKELPFLMEDPGKIDLTRAIEYGLKKNFDSRIEFEHAMQSKHLAKASFLNLLPHLSLSSVLSNIAPSAMSLLGSIGDLAPFLLPNRWFQAKANSFASKAEAYALILMQADLATQIEGMSYALSRDTDIYRSFTDVFETTKKARDKVQELESSGKITAGSTDTMDAIVNSMKLDLSSLGMIVKEDRVSIAQTLGLHNPDAIDDVILGSEENPIDQAGPIQYQTLLPEVLSRSFELRQIDFLTDAAKFQKKEIYFSWLDPAGDTNSELGFSLGENIAIADSKIRELQIQREQLQSVLSQKLDLTVIEYNGGIKSYHVAKDGMEIQKRRLDRELELLRPDSGISLFDLQSILDDYLSNEAREKSLLAGFRVARSKIDRLLLLGHYRDVAENHWGH